MNPLRHPLKNLFRLYCRHSSSLFNIRSLVLFLFLFASFDSTSFAQGAGTYQVAVYGGNANGYGDYKILTMSIANVGAPAVEGLRWASRFVGAGNGASEIDYAGGWYVSGSYWNDGASLNLYRTQDGINWQKVKVTDNQQLVDLAQSGSTWLALTNNGSVFRSVNSGGNWTLAGTAPGIGSNGTYVEYSNTSSIVYNNGTWVFVSDKTAYRSSNNGTTWSSNATGSDMSLYDLGVGNGVLVAIGEGGEIRTSSNAGQTWTKRTSSTDLTLNSVAFGNGRFVVVGSNGLVLTSTDNGTTWVSQASGSSSYLESVSFGNNVFVRSDGYVSSDGIAWSAPQAGWGNCYYDDGVVYGNAGWLMGNGGTVHQSVAGDVPNGYTMYGSLPAASGTVGQSLSYQISGALSFSTTPTQYAAINLPGGLSINSTSGDISGVVYKTIPSVISGGGFFFKSLAGGFIQSLPGSSYGFGGAAGSVDGNGSTALFNSPSGVAVDAIGNICVSDSGNHVIRKITSSGNVTLFAGSFLGSGTADGWGEDARFNNPQGLAIDASGNLYVAEAGSHRIRKVSPFGQVTHYVGGIGVSGSVDGSPISARFNGPTDVAVDAAGNIYVTDSGNHAIRKISTNGTVTTLAGSMGQAGNTNATGSAARFRTPQGIAVDGNGTVYVADTGNQVIRKVTSGGIVTTFSGAAFTGSASPLGGRASFSGSAHAAFLASVDSTSLPASLDGNATIARFSYPTDVTLDSAGNLYVTDSGAEKIRKIDLTGNVTTLGGSPDGFFYNPLAIAVGASGTLYVADAGNNRIAMSFTPSPEISIEDLGGIDLSSAGEVISLGNLLTGNASASYSFVIRNVGYADLSGLSVSKNGTHSGDFALGLLGASSLGAGNSTTFTVAFSPISGGNRTIQIAVASNDIDENPVIINLAGFGLSASLDSDGDGLSDAAEYRMSSLGFDWQLAQADMVSAFQSGANTGGLYNTSQIQAMNIGIPLISKNATSGQFEISVKLQKSTNLQTFQQFSLNATDTTIEPDGSLKIRFIAPDSTAFFRLQAK
jgi:sugar lactone lactonase YvrE